MIKILETSREQKAKRLFKNPEKSKAIKTFAIMTANNPDQREFTRKSNDKFNKQLKDLMAYDKSEKQSADAETILNRYNFNYYKVKGKYGNKEDSFIIYNITLKDAKSLATRFEQQSFIYGENTDNGLVFQFWANKSKSGYVYALADERAEYEDEGDSEDFYTQISRDFKISIPFEKFGFEDSEKIENLYPQYYNKNRYNENFESEFYKKLNSSMDESLTFMGRVSRRIDLK